MFRWVEWRDEGCLWSRWPYRRRGDGLQQMRPVLEDNIDGDSPQMLEEAVCRGPRNDRGGPGGDPEISGGVECESEQIEGDQDAMLLQFGALQVLGNGLMRSWLAG